MWEQRVNGASAAPGSVLTCKERHGFKLDTVPGLNAGSTWMTGAGVAVVVSWGDYTNYVLVLYAGHVGWAPTWLWEAA